jgi:ABC-type lipoprotein export system ATPase subunit
MSAGAPLALCAGVDRTYGHGAAATVALAPTDCRIDAGDRIALVGPSGSGKSTLLHLIAGLDTPTHGLIGWPAIGAREDLQPGRVAVIFQGPSLLPALTVLENVALALVLDGIRDGQARAEAREALDMLSLGELADKLPEEISGGQAQRVAVARALAGRPEIVFADEPTGNLDSRSGAEILGFMRRAVRELGQTIVMVTHDPVAASYADRVVFLADGHIVDELLDPTTDGVIDFMKSLGRA